MAARIKFDRLEFSNHVLIDDGGPPRWEFDEISNVTNSFNCVLNKLAFISEDSSNFGIL